MKTQLVGTLLLSIVIGSCSLINSGPNAQSCDSVVTMQEALLTQAGMPTSDAGSCTQNSDCTLLTYPGSMAPIAVNQQLAQRYNQIVSSWSYASLAQQQTGACGPFNGTTAFDSKQAVCQSGTCSSLSCDGIDNALQSLLAKYVNVTDEASCAQNSDCTSTNTGGMCGNIVMNNTAAAGYAAYFKDPQYTTLQHQQQAVCPVTPMNGMCVAPAHSPYTCQNGTCVGTY